MTGHRPAAEIRLGRIKASIWANEGENGERVAHGAAEPGSTADLAHSKVCELEAGRPDEESPAEETEA